MGLLVAFEEVNRMVADLSLPLMLDPKTAVRVPTPPLVSESLIQLVLVPE